VAQAVSMCKYEYLSAFCDKLPKLIPCRCRHKYTFLYNGTCDWDGLDHEALGGPVMKNQTLYVTKNLATGEVVLESDRKVLKRLGKVDFPTAQKAAYNFFWDAKPKGLRHICGRTVRS